MDSNRKVRSCPECKTELLTRNFFAHLRNVHCWDEEKINEQKQKSQKQLNSPMSVSISTTSLPSESDSSHSTDKSEGIFCPADDCDYVYDNSVNLAIHWQQEHCSDDIQAEEYGIHEKLFTSLDDFEKWKMTAETAACVKWIRRSSREGNIYFKCSRAGTYRSESNGLRVGHETKKATRICTSFCIVSSLCPGSVLATFCLGHAGHIADVAKLPFNEAEQKFIEQLIKTGKHTISTAIDFLRSNQTPDMPRLYFTTRQDIRNIMDMLNIVPGKRCENDLISLKIRAEEEGTAGGFRFLQFPNSVTGDEFILVLITDQQVDWLQKYGSRGICIDDTFNSTKYPLKLATLLVVDDFDRGLPAGFLLSRKMTSKEVELLFSVIKALLPDFKPEYFMSDAAEAFRNGFKKIYPATQAQFLICRFHVFQAWKRESKSKIANPEHRQVLLTKLNLLLKTNIRKVFFERASELCDYLHQTKEIAFLQYISKYISDANSIASWATFPRTGTPFNTSMYSETWHRLLKTDRLNRKENNRVDYLVHVLLETLDFIKKTHEINERRGLATISSRRQQTHSRHRTAVELIRTDGVNVQNRGDGLFQILSSDKVTCYTLRFLICRCNSTRNVHCSECDVCPYSVLCSCVDEKAGVSCKHGHILKIWLDKQNGATINVSDCADQPDTFKVTILIQLTEAKECAPLAKSQILDAIQEDSAMLGQLYMAILKCGGDQGSRFTHARSQIRSQIEQMLEAIKGEDERTASLPVRTEVITAPNKLASGIRLEKRHEQKARSNAEGEVASRKRHREK